ncbi:MAG TPA: hypothetical protein VFS39_15260 [Nitrospira sp.]|nr:hypothetical protein [Nitrospira sp.]
MTRRVPYPWLIMALIVLSGALALFGGKSGEATSRGRDHLVGPVRQTISTSNGTSTTELYDRNGALLTRTIRTAPPAGQPDLGEQVRTINFSFDAQGRRTRETIDEGDGQPYLSRLYAVDAAGRTVAEAAYHMCGTFSSLVVHVYDETGALRQDLTYQFRALLARLYEYDSRGRISTHRDYKNGRLLSSTLFRYDERDRVSERLEYDPRGALLATTAYHYDDRGHPVAEETIHPGDASLNSKSVSTYEFDARGNWTKRTVRHPIIPLDEEGKPAKAPIEVTERSISYYGD